MRYIDTNAGLASAADAMRSAGLFAADTEAAGYHRYSDRVSLVQLSTRDETFIVDPFAVDDLGALREPLASPAIEVIFHDADFDLRLLHRDHGLTVRGLFDTKIAAELLGEPALGLASLLEAHLGVSIPKKYQRADWAKRPLPDDMIQYAAEDTRHLPALRDELHEKLVQAGRLHWAEEEFALREQTLWEDDDEADAFRIKGSHRLDRRHLAVLREVYQWRDRLARERDRAPFRIVGNDALLGVAQAVPRTRDELADVSGLADSHVRRFGGELVDAVRRAVDMPQQEWPERPERAPRRQRDPEFDERVDRLRSVRDRAAEEHGLGRGVILPRRQMETIVRADPGTLAELRAVDGLRAWQVEIMGEPILAALR